MKKVNRKKRELTELSNNNKTLQFGNKHNYVMKI